MIIKTGTIYKATSQTSGKSYIGQTSRPAFDLHKRIKEHIKFAYDKNSKKAHFQKAILKYGYEDFEWKVLEEPLLKNLNKQEVLWISTFNTYKKGYNSFPGGEYISPNGNEKIFAFRETRCCRTCGTVFSIRVKDIKEKIKSGKYCSYECWLIWRKNHSKKLTKICPICGEVFDTYQNQIYCSRKCKGKNHTWSGTGIKKIRRIDRKCEWCDNIFSVPVSANGISEATIKKLNKKYCSDECRLKATKVKKIIKICPTCNNEFKTRACKTKTYCCSECYFKSLRITKKCEWCEREFETAPSDNKKYCCEECWINWKEKIKREALITSICLECGEKFEYEKWRDQKYCSKECAWKSKKGECIKKICPECENEFEVPIYQKFVKCCSKECSNKMGFETDIKNRKSHKWKEWKKYKTYKYHLVIYKHSPNYYMYIRDENFIQIVRKSTGKKIYEEAEEVLFNFIDCL